MRALLRSSFIRFCLVGMVNTFAGLGAIFMLRDAGGVSDVPASLIGNATGLGVSFVLNRAFTFRASGPLVPMLFRFLVTFFVAYAIDLVVLLALRHHGGIEIHLVHVLATIPYTLVFYCMSRYFVFPAHRRTLPRP